MPKVLDFGIAKALDQGEVTTGSTTLGPLRACSSARFDYMAPEQVAGDDVSRSWDVWALSVRRFRDADGRHPFRRGVTVGMPGMRSTLPQTVRRPPVRPRCVQAFFHRALSPDRAQRPPDADSFLVEIERVLA